MTKWELTKWELIKWELTKWEETSESNRELLGLFRVGGGSSWSFAVSVGELVGGGAAASGEASLPEMRGELCGLGITPDIV